MKIAVVGSINIDQSVETDRIPRKGETIAGQSLKYTPGGKGDGKVRSRSSIFWLCRR